MTLQNVKLSDRYDLDKKTVLLSGTQALIRATLMQKQRDKADGINSAGFITGYRGSPLGNLDFQMQRIDETLKRHDILFQAGINEDLAATAIWGTQQAHLRNENTHDGVFGLWYGKGPGVDRSGDVFRHANLAGTAPKGGVLVAMGDDHTCESSTTAHQSEFALVDAMMPILSPAGVQEILDFSTLGWALSRYASLWVGIKCVKDTVESTAVVDADPMRMTLKSPDHNLPEGGVNIRLNDHPTMQEARLHEHKIDAAMAFSRANRFDKIGFTSKASRIGIVSAGKSWLDVVHALELLGIDQSLAEKLGIRTYKLGLVWPIEPQGLQEFAEALDMIIVVEEKRDLIEAQIRNILYNMPDRPRVIGKQDEIGATLFPAKMALDTVDIAQKLGTHILSECGDNPIVIKSMDKINAALTPSNAPDLGKRTPYFCAGCPHNSSTKIPEGSRAYAGIGCHYMVQWMDRETEGYTHMGAEGANWTGEAHFSTLDHVFQNIGDGTYNHSGHMAIRAAAASGVNITYKILYNDAVAMTGGQTNDGELDPIIIAKRVWAEGAKEIAIISDEPEKWNISDFPAGATLHHRKDLNEVQKHLRTVKGLSVMIYDQTCAAEKRRRRKRGEFPDPDKRVFINDLVCEGCGDCGIASNCVAVTPKETDFGRKRQIDQSSCNKDFSCIDGFCPSFVTLHGAKPKKQAAKALNLPDMPEPVLKDQANIVISGVGGQGVVTIGALLSMAAHLEGKGTGMIEMAGLAQKGGSVMIHCRIALSPNDISAIRVSLAEADVILGGDIVVSAGEPLLALSHKDSNIIVNSHETTTGDFTRNADFNLPFERMKLAIKARVNEGNSVFHDFSQLAAKLLGDAIYANAILLGVAWQKGSIPLSKASIQQAIKLNGAGVEGTLMAFELGRWVAHDADAVYAMIAPVAKQEQTLGDIIAKRIAFLAGYQNHAYAEKYKARVEAFAKIDTELATIVAKNYFKLLAYKDEYEVARLHSEYLSQQISDNFDGVRKIEFHLAPPILGRKNKDGMAQKSKFGPWMMWGFKWLAKGKFLRGTMFDLFGYTAERKQERTLIAAYETDLDMIKEALPTENRDILLELATLPEKIRGYGHVKAAHIEVVKKHKAELLGKLDTIEAAKVAAE